MANYKCSICQKEVRLTGDSKTYSCEHKGAPIIVEMQSNVAGRGGLKI